MIAIFELKNELQEDRLTPERLAEIKKGTHAALINIFVPDRFFIRLEKAFFPGSTSKPDHFFFFS